MRPRLEHGLDTSTEVSVLDDVDDLPPLREAWDELQTDVVGPGTNFDAIFAQLNLLRRDERPCVVTTWDHGCLTGVAPLVRTGGLPARLSLATDDVAGFLYTDETYLDRLVDAVLDLGLPLDLDPLLADGTTTRRLLARTHGRGTRRVSIRWGGPSIPLDASWSDPSVKLRRRRRADLRRSTRRAEELGEVTFHIASGDEVEDAFDELVRVEARGWKARAGTALIDDPRQRETLRRFVTATEVRHSVRAIIMRIGDQTAGVDLNVILGDRLWGLKGGVDERFGPAAPGLQLKVRSIELAVREGLHHYELMGATAPFKEIWGIEPLRLCRTRVFPRSLHGIAALGADSVSKARTAIPQFLDGSSPRSPGALLARTLRPSGVPRRTDATAARAAMRRPGVAIGSGRDDLDRTVRVVTDPDGLDALRPSWRELDVDVPGPSTDLDWVRVYAESAAPDRRLCLLTVQERGRVTAIAPLLYRRWPIPRLELVPLDVASLLYADGGQLRRLANAILGLRLPVTLDALPAGGLTDRTVRSNPTAYVRTSSRLGGPSQPIDATFADPLAKLPSRKRNDLRRKLRRAEQHGEVSFEVSAPGADFAARFDEFVRVEGSGWKARAGTSLAREDAKRQMLWRYLNAAHVRPRVRLATMRIDGRAVAADLAVLSGNRYWFHKGGFDVAYADCSPGILLKVHALGWAAQEGLERFEFMGEPERYKQTWGAEPRELHTHAIYPRSIAGGLALGADAAAKARRIVVRTWEAAYRRHAESDSVNSRRVEVLHDARDLEPWREDWEHLRTDIAAPSSDLDWTLAYGSVLARGERLRIVTVLEGDRLVAVAPLVLGAGPLGRLRLVDNEPCGFRYADEDAHRRLLAGVLALRQPLSLDALPVDSPSDVGLDAAAGRGTLLVSRTRMGGASVPLDASWKEPLNKLKRRRRRDLQRRLRNAESLGPVRMEVVAPGADLSELWAEFVRIEASSWKRRSGTALACGTWEHDLLWRYLASPHVRERVRFTVLRIGGTAVAMEVGVIVEGRLWALKTGYDEAFAALSPGGLVAAHALGWAAGEGLTHYEQMGANEPYKQVWGAPPRQLRRSTLYPASPRSAAVLGADVATKASRVAARRVSAARADPAANEPRPRHPGRRRARR